MMFSMIIQGFIIGFSLAAPVGPLGLLCIQRTLARGFLFGLLTGLGVAFADAAYGLTAAFGVTVVSDFLIAHQTVLGIMGGFFLSWLGFKTVLNSSSKVSTVHVENTGGHLRAFLSAFLITLTNPMTILSYVAIFSSATFAIGEKGAAFILTLAIFVGSLSWWVILSSVVAATKHKIRPEHMRLINICSGLLLLAIGLYMGGRQMMPLVSSGMF